MVPKMSEHLDFFMTEAQFKAMSDAIRGHSDYAKNAVRGLGVDRLLQGMRRLALETNMPLPELYDDPGYIRSSRYWLRKCDLINDSENLQ
jgi:hypothetical protein